MRADGKVHSGFTLIELLVVIGIIGVLASVVIIAVNPRGNILATRDAERKHNIRELQSALMQYLMDEAEYPNQEDIPSAQAAAKPICTQTVTANSACVQLDALVGEYLAAIPRDEVEPCADFTGYQLYTRAGRGLVIATHMGKVSGDEGITVLPGCGDGLSSSSASSSVAPVSSSTSSSVSSIASSSSSPVSSTASSTMSILYGYGS